MMSGTVHVHRLLGYMKDCTYLNKEDYSYFSYRAFIFYVTVDSAVQLNIYPTF